MIDGLYERIVNDVKSAAFKAEQRWRNIMDADDIEQELWMFITTSPAVQEYLSTADKTQTASALLNKADSICSEERLALDRFHGNWHYNVAEIKSLLQRYNTSDPIPDEERFDLEESLEHLKAINIEYYDLLIDVYENGEVEKYRQGNLQRRHARAHEKLTDIMNLKKSEMKKERHEGLGTAPTDTINREDY